MPTKRTFKVPPGLSTTSLSNLLQPTTTTDNSVASNNLQQTAPSHNTTPTNMAKTTECALIGAKLLHKGENQHQVLGKQRTFVVHLMCWFWVYKIYMFMMIFMRYYDKLWFCTVLHLINTNPRPPPISS